MAFEALLESSWSGSPQAGGWTRRVWEAGRRRQALTSHTDAYRLFDGEADGAPGIVIERYGDFAVLNAFVALDAASRDAIARALLDVGARGVYFKARPRADLRGVSREQETPDGPLFGESAPPEFVVSEHGARFLVRLGDGFSTGLFLDQRDNRVWLRGHAAGRRVLNLFAYTGSFSVVAAAGNAERTTTVDLSGAALKRCDENLRQNGLNGPKQRLLRADAVAWLRRAVARKDEYDVVVLDPPSFASVGAQTFSVARQYQELVTHCLQLLAPGGTLLAVTNHQGTSVDDFVALLNGAARGLGRSIAKLELPPSPLDFPQAARQPDLGTKSARVRLRPISGR